MFRRVFARPQRARWSDFNVQRFAGDGEPHGFGRWYHPDGTTVYVQGLWDRGVVEGEAVVFYPNGRIEIEGFFRRGVPHGRCIVYDEHGHKRFEGRFHQGYMQEGSVYRPGNVLEYRGRLRRVEGLRFRTVRVVPRDDEEPESYQLASPTRPPSPPPPPVRDAVEANQCIFCLRDCSGASYAYVPCGHNIICADCANSVDARWRSECPVCKEASTLLRIHRL